MWSNGGVAITNGNGITVSDTTEDVTVTSTLTFDPLWTSHKGSFVCSGTLTSPALDATLITSTVEELEVQSEASLDLWCIYYIHTLTRVSSMIAIISFSPCSLYS